MWWHVLYFKIPALCSMNWVAGLKRKEKLGPVSFFFFFFESDYRKDILCKCKPSDFGLICIYKTNIQYVYIIYDTYNYLFLFL